jgi:hypothetical protein
MSGKALLSAMWSLGLLEALEAWSDDQIQQAA